MARHRIAVIEMRMLARIKLYVAARPIVPKKSPNKASASAAEEMEGRGLAKGNLGQQNASRTQSRIKGSPATGLRRWGLSARQVSWRRYDKRQNRTRM
jgi:hypothetical protein